MTTPEQLGMIRPTGADLINEGDNAISQNALAVAMVYDEIQTDFGGLPQDISNLDAAAAKMRGTVPEGTDLNDLRDSGSWYTGSLANTGTLANMPFQWPGIIHVISDNTTFVTVQWAYRYGTSFAALWRVSLTSATWTPWQNAEWYKGNIPEGSNLDTLAPGSYRIPVTAAIATYTGTALPENKVGIFIVDGGTNSGPKSQEYFTHGAGAKRYWRSSLSLTGSWNPWSELGAPTPQTPAPTYGAGSPNMMRLQAFKDENPLVSTGNKGVVVFRYDHGLTNFKAHLWPLHQAAGVPAYIAMNSRLWDITENSGATQAEAKAWRATGLVKFGNHTADHIDRNTAEGIYDTIVNGRKELETQLGGIIHGFTVPGLSEYNQFEGFGAGTLNSFSDTLAGSLILSNHAITSGMVPSPGTAFRPLDGQIRQGGRHFTWESETLENIKAQIDIAADTKTALTIMCHPRTMGSTSGGKTYWTPALAAQVIDYVKSLIDAGQLANIDYYQSHHATL